MENLDSEKLISEIRIIKCLSGHSDKIRMWERPLTVPFPSIWRQFEGIRNINGVIPSFWIQDIPVEEYDTVVDCMINKFCGDEPLTKYSDISNDKKSIEDIRNLWYDVLNDKLGLICYMKNPDKNGKPIFAGVNCTHKKIILSDNNSEFKGQGKAFRKIFDTVEFLMEQKNAFKELDSNVLLSAMGLYVLPEFRGQNIGLELLRARENLCKAVDIKASVTVFTATASQLLADRAGYKILYEISYDDLEKENPVLSFPGINNHTKNIQLKYKVFS